LDKSGRQDARALVPMLAAFNPRRVLAADRVRCEQTVRPLAERLSLPLIEAPALSDEAFDKDRDRALAEVRALMAEPGSTVICSQGHMLPELLMELIGTSPANSSIDLTGPLEHPSSQDQPYPSRKGSVWALSVADRGSWLEAARPDQPPAAYSPKVVAADYYPRPGG
jgi:8-oxo-dGTP diphosphatase